MDACLVMSCVSNSSYAFMMLSFISSLLLAFWTYQLQTIHWRSAGDAATAERGSYVWKRLIMPAVLVGATRVPPVLSRSGSSAVGARNVLKLLFTVVVRLVGWCGSAGDAHCYLVSIFGAY